MATQVGIPIFPTMELRGAKLKFRDNFADANLYWGWRQYLGLNPAGKSGWEIAGQYNLQVNNLVNGSWDIVQSQAPRIFMGVLSYPCEIKTRLDTFTANVNTRAGLFITKDALGFGADLHWSIIQNRSGAGNGVAVYRDDSIMLAIHLVPTLPMWLRLRLGCGSYRGLNVYFDYSLDGVNWINLWVENTSITYLTLNPPAVGLYVSNFAPFNLVTGRFDFFQMKPQSIN